MMYTIPLPHTCNTTCKKCAELFFFGGGDVLNVHNVKGLDKEVFIVVFI